MIVEKPEGPEKDAFLVELIRMVEIGGLGIPLTLNVKGTIVHGEVITKQAYFDSISQILSEKLTNRGFTEAGKKLRENFYPWDTDSDIKPDPDENYQYIHMCDTKLFGTDGQHLPENGALWRGRVSEVDGFIIGRLAVVPVQQE